MKWQASRELLSPRADVWALVAEPFHLPDWWPDVTGVVPDKRGFAEGARWQVTFARHNPLAPMPATSNLLIVKRIEPPSLVRWHHAGQKVDLELRLDVAAEGHTLATVTLEGSWRPEILGRRRSLPQAAVNRLYELCQTAASL
jgi:uncharacterized protein YndB with AHSA1/START domain